MNNVLRQSGKWCLVFLLAVVPVLAGEFVVIESFDHEEPRVVDGNMALINQEVPMASTFKILLAWIAMEEGLIRPDTKIRCWDKHVPLCPGNLDLHAAMLYSSNEYFVVIGRKLGREKIEAYLKRTGLFPKLPRHWLKKGMGQVVSGGELRISPLQQHRLLKTLILGTVCSPGVQQHLVQVMSWPSPDVNSQLFGKTGSAQGVLWFSGFGWTGGRKRFVTVFRKGRLNERVQVIQQFYDRFGCRYDHALLYPSKEVPVGTVWTP